MKESCVILCLLESKNRIKGHYGYIHVKESVFYSENVIDFTIVVDKIRHDLGGNTF